MTDKEAPKLPKNVTPEEIKQAVREIVYEQRHAFAKQGIGAGSQAFADAAYPILLKGAEIVKAIEEKKLAVGDYAPPGMKEKGKGKLLKKDGTEWWEPLT
jgi:hypothetical protein